jgi:hypothetical protein
MSAVGRILLVVLTVVGVILIVAGTASLAGADSWTSPIDNIIDNIDIDSGVFRDAGDGGVPLGIILLAASIMSNTRPTD